MPTRVLTSGRAIVDRVPSHGPRAQPMVGQVSLSHEPICLSTALSVGGAGGERWQKGIRPRWKPSAGCSSGCQESAQV